MGWLHGVFCAILFYLSYIYFLNFQSKVLYDDGLPYAILTIKTSLLV